MQHTELTTNNSPSTSSEFDDWADFTNLDAFEIKKEEVAADLANLLVHSGHNRTYVSAMTGWSKSRVSNLLSGDLNLTLKSIWDFSNNLGYTFDISFRKASESPKNQPWIEHKKDVSTEVEYSENNNSIYLVCLKTAEDVAKDMLNGTPSEYYLSLEKKPNCAIEKGRTFDAFPIKSRSDEDYDESNFVWTLMNYEK